MIKFVFAAVAAISVATGLSAAELKIGAVDMLMLVRNHPNYDSNKELLSSTDKDYQKKLESIKSEGEKFQEEGKKLMEQMQSPMLADKAKKDIEKQLMEIQKKLMAIEQRYRSEAMRCRQDLQDLEGRLLKTTTDDLRKRIRAYADQNGYDIILDRSATPYVKDELDVSNAILSGMGVDASKIKAKNEGK